MDRESLRLLLAQGLSLAEIGRRFDRHESTIAYWVQKHGLEAVNRERHAARGGLTREELEPLVAAGMSIREIAARLGVSYTTIRHWVVKHGLSVQSHPGRRSRDGVEAARAAGATRARIHCPRHGETEHVVESRGYFRCCRCREEAVIRRRRKVKELLVQEQGGCCRLCGYNRSFAALHFHHVDPQAKEFGVSRRGAHAIDRLRAEVRKCVLLCSNCHAEVESGARSLQA